MSNMFEYPHHLALKSWAYLPSRDIRIVELSGDDRIDWLQGQATNDMRMLAQSAEPISFCLCKATGQLEGLCDAWSSESKILIVTDIIGANILLERADKMVVLEDVQARQLDQLDVVEAAHLPKLDEAQRIELGIPRRGQDFDDRTLAPELGSAFEKKYISYNKGCYTGQEVLMRIHSRGHTNKTWFGLLLDAPVNVGAKVSSAGSEKNVGLVTSVAVSPRLGPIAAATLRNEAAQEDAEVIIGDVRGRVKNFPLI